MPHRHRALRPGGDPREHAREDLRLHARLPHPAPVHGPCGLCPEALEILHGFKAKQIFFAEGVSEFAEPGALDLYSRSGGLSKPFAEEAVHGLSVSKSPVTVQKMSCCPRTSTRF